MRRYLWLLPSLLVLATGCWAAEPDVGRVVAENLASWRFRPGDEVFVNQSDRRASVVALAANPAGSLLTAWVESSRSLQGLRTATSVDGTDWHTDLSLDRPGRPGALAAALGAAGETVLAWVENDGCYVLRRPPGEDWGEPSLILARSDAPASVALSAAPDGSFYLLVFADPPSCRLWRSSPGESAWQELPAVSVDLSGVWAGTPVLLGWRDGLLLVVGNTMVRLGPDGTWQAPEALPWSPPPLDPRVVSLWAAPPGEAAALTWSLASVGHGALLSAPAGLRSASSPALGSIALGTSQPPEALPSSPPSTDPRVVSLWAAPPGEAAALTWSLDPVRHGALLSTSPDLRSWSSPAFLGFVARFGQAAVATTPTETYVATLYEPYARDRLERWGHETVTWSSPRVFRIDEGLTHDTDGDGLTDLAEEWLLTDYANPDTDGDGVRDGEDLDPLAASVPDTDDAAIRQAIFSYSVPSSMDVPLVVTAPERQVFLGHQIRVLSLTPQEVEAYRAKCGWDLPWQLLDIKNVAIDAAAGTATAEWALIAGPLAASGSTATLERRDGDWVVTGETGRWVA